MCVRTVQFTEKLAAERERERGCYINAGLFSVSVSVSVSVLAVRLLRLSFALE